MIKSILLWTVIGVVLAFVLLAVAYTRKMNQAYERIAGKSEIITSPIGNIEYAEGGSGPPVLVIHGGGGGFDQGELIARTILTDKFHWIAPSRFGYLRSEMPENATWDEQAQAYAVLLDKLGVHKVSVVAVSQGGPSALLFAVLYPERVSSLTLLSCGITPSASENQAEANKKGNMLKTIFSNDLAYWAITKAFKKQFMGLMGANKEVVANLTPAQKLNIDHFIDYMNPVEPRSAGAIFDNITTLPGKRIAAIPLPVLIVHAKDDMLQLYHNAEFAQATLPNAKLLSFEQGGHLLMFIEQETIQQAVKDHILGHLSVACSNTR